LINLNNLTLTQIRRVERISFEYSVFTRLIRVQNELIDTSKEPGNSSVNRTINTFN